MSKKKKDNKYINVKQSEYYHQRQVAKNAPKFREYILELLTLTGKTIEEIREYERKQERARWSAYQKKYVEKNKAHIRETQREYQKRNKEKLNEYQRNYYYVKKEQNKNKDETEN